MGKAIVLTDCNFSTSNIGRVTFISTPPSEPSEPGVTLINNNISYSLSPTSVVATLDYNANSALIINLSGLGQITILAGSNRGAVNFDSSTTERTATVSISPTSDSKYRYVSYQTSLTIPASQAEPVVPTSLMIVGNREAAGSLGAGEYFILNTDTMKVVTSNASPASDEEYYGAIMWSTGSSAATLNNMGSYASLDISANGNITVAASIGGQSILPVSVACVYSAADYQLRNFDDLKAVETAINNSTEASIALTSTSGRTATNGSGFSGFTFLVLNDINCNGSHVEIGYSTDSSKKPFKGVIDGGCHSLSNIAGNCGVSGTAANGGKIGNCLIGYGKDCTVRNLNLVGSVTNIATRGFATVIGLYEGTCTLSNIYCAVDVVQSSGVTAGCVLIAGWSVSSGVANLNNVIYQGNFSSNYSISGLVNASDSVINCATLGKLTYDASSRNSGVLTAITTGPETVYNSFALASLNILSSSSTEKVSIITNSSGSYCYEACDISADLSSKYFSASNSSDSYTTNSLDKATPSQKSEMSSHFESNENFISSQGYMPILFNRMARLTSILNAAKL